MQLSRHYNPREEQDRVENHQTKYEQQKYTRYLPHWFMGDGEKHNTKKRLAIELLQHARPVVDFGVRRQKNLSRF